MTGKHSKQYTTNKAIFFRGHSGATVHEVDGKIVKKVSKDQIRRFHRSLRKMEEWQKIKDPSFMAVPEILQEPTNDMATISKLEGLDFYSRIHDIDEPFNEVGANKILMVIQHLQKICSVDVVPQEKLQDKIMSLTCHKKGQEYVVENLANTVFQTAIGHSHGDFSLANIIFQWDGKIGLFDFADDIVESPMFDLIKMRLDVTHHWTLWLNDLEMTERYSQFAKYLRNNINLALLQTYRLTKPQVSAFTVMWLMRILQYAKNSSTERFLVKAIEEEMKCPRLS